MREINFQPLYNSTIGFDKLVHLLDTVNSDVAPNYPPFNIERSSENDYRITMAVAGFEEPDLSIETKESVLTVSGNKPPENEHSEYLHRGIATRTFIRRFQLADYLKVQSAKLENGLLHIDLVREVPESLKPRTIDITENGKLAKK